MLVFSNALSVRLHGRRKRGGMGNEKREENREHEQNFFGSMHIYPVNDSDPNWNRFFKCLVMLFRHFFVGRPIP